MAEPVSIPGILLIVLALFAPNAENQKLDPGDYHGQMVVVGRDVRAFPVQFTVGKDGVVSQMQTRWNGKAVVLTRDGDGFVLAEPKGCPHVQLASPGHALEWMAANEIWLGAVAGPPTKVVIIGKGRVLAGRGKHVDVDVPAFELPLMIGADRPGGEKPATDAPEALAGPGNVTFILNDGRYPAAAVHYQRTWPAGKGTPATQPEVTIRDALRQALFVPGMLVGGRPTGLLKLAAGDYEGLLSGVIDEPVPVTFNVAGDGQVSELILRRQGFAFRVKPSADDEYSLRLVNVSALLADDGRDVRLLDGRGELLVPRVAALAMTPDMKLAGKGRFRSPDGRTLVAPSAIVQRDKEGGAATLLFGPRVAGRQEEQLAAPVKRRAGQTILTVRLLALRGKLLAAGGDLVGDVAINFANDDFDAEVTGQVTVEGNTTLVIKGDFMLAGRGDSPSLSRGSGTVEIKLRDLGQTSVSRINFQAKDLRFTGSPANLPRGLTDRMEEPKPPATQPAGR